MIAGRCRDERGSAIVEFHFLGLLLLVPLVYVLLTVFQVQSAAYGVTQAAREAGRVYVRGGDEAAARFAAGVALADQGLDEHAATVRLGCAAAPCFAPGREVSVDVRAVVRLPFVPEVLAGAVRAEIPVSARHVAVVDRFRELG